MNYHNITHCDQNNGDGLRVVLWLSGCSHKCKGCQNPQTWNKYSGIKFDEQAINEICDELSKDYISGITFTGGDPLYEDNIEHVNRIITLINNRFPDKTIWLYTGCLFEEVPMSILNKIDVLIDGEYKEELQDITLKWRGSSNQRVIDVQASLKQGDVVLYAD